MTFDVAIRATEILLALAFLQQSLEHIFTPQGARVLFIIRGVLSLAVLTGWQVPWVLAGLCVHSGVVLHRFQGPYNGGSDRMGVLVLYCLSLSHWLPSGVLSEAAFGYLGVQVVLSYFISGQVKIVNPEWRSGRALQDVFRFSAYPVAETLRALADRPKLVWTASWAVMVFEVLFPFSFLNAWVLVCALCVAIAFHVANACLFGLNRFVWFWIAAYPSILWLQGRLIA